MRPFARPNDDDQTAPGAHGRAAVPLAAALLSLVTLAAARAVPLSAAPSGVRGPGFARLVVVNRDEAQPAVVVADFYKQGGPNTAVTVAHPSVPPRGSTEFVDPIELTNGVFAVIASSDRAIGALGVTQWATSGGYIAEAAGAPGKEVVVPLATIKYYGHTTIVSIQNTDTSQVVIVTVDLFPAGDAAPAVSKAYQIQPGSSVTLDLAKDAAFVGVVPNTPGGFLGSLRVSSAVDVAVHAIHDVEISQRAVYDFDGLPRDAAAPLLHVPLIAQGAARDAAVQEHAWIAVQNAGDATATVQVTYRGVGGSCDGRTFVHGPRMLPPLAMALFDTADEAGAATLPAGCLASATIASDGAPLAAAVVHILVDAPAGGSQPPPNVQAVTRAAATLAMPTGAAAADWILWRWHRPWAADGGLSEAIVHNPGAEDVTVDLELKDATGAPVTGCGAPCRAVIPAGGTHRFLAADQDALAMQFAGSAVVHGDAPVLVWLRQSFHGGGDDETLSAAIPAAGAADRRAFVPFYMSIGTNATSPARTATASPTATATGGPPTATATNGPPTATPAPRISPTPVESPTPTDTPTPVDSPTAAGTPTRTPAPVDSPTAAGTPTRTPAPPATASPSGAPTDAVRPVIYLPFARG